MGTEPLLWERDGSDWPHRQASEFKVAGGLRWHVQRFACQGLPGAANPPVVLLIHGTGSATHTWRGLAPLLAQHAEVLSMDLPGHGFSALPPGAPPGQWLSLNGMAQALGALLLLLERAPTLVIGHSAGAAIALRMCLDGRIAPRSVIGINAALLPLGGLAGQFFSPVAKLMAATPWVPRLFSWQARHPAVLQRLIQGTGSQLDATGLALYGRLVRNAGHAAGALGMMANWDLQGLAADLHRLRTPLSLVVGSADRTVSPAQAGRVMASLPAAMQRRLHSLQGLGHLAHEERPDLVCALALAELLEPQG